MQYIYGNIDCKNTNICEVRASAFLQRNYDIDFPKMQITFTSYSGAEPECRFEELTTWRLSLSDPLEERDVPFLPIIIWYT